MAFISEIRAGDLNTRIGLKLAIQTADDFGGYTTSYLSFAQVWAKLDIKTIRNVNEKFEGDQLVSYGRYVITVRYSSDTKLIRSNTKISNLDTGVDYDVIGYVVDPRKEYIQIFVKEDIPTS